MSNLVPQVGVLELLQEACEMLDLIGGSPEGIRQDRAEAEYLQERIRAALASGANQQAAPKPIDELLAAIGDAFERSLGTIDGKILAAMIREGVTELDSHIQYAFAAPQALPAPASQQTAPDVQREIPPDRTPNPEAEDGKPQGVRSTAEERP